MQSMQVYGNDDSRIEQRKREKNERRGKKRVRR